MTTVDTPRDHLRRATHAFVSLVQLVPDGAWDDQALGVWTVRDLVGHTGRALTTLDTYLASPAEHAVLPDAPAYFRAAAGAGAGIADAVAERGRAAGRDLGADPAGAVAALAERVLPLVDAAPDDAVLGIPLGPMRLVDYLPTRTFELVVHSLDLQAALDVAWTVPAGPLAAAVRLAADLAVSRGHGPDLLLALAGRRPLPDHLSVV